MSDLKACPFCGGKAGRADNEFGTTIVCDNDDCIVSAYSAAGRPEVAVAAWNTRHGDAPPSLALPEIPDDDGDFTPDLARKIIAKYQQLLRAAPQPPKQRQFRHLKRGTTYRLASIEFAADDANENAPSSADRKIWCGTLGKWAQLQGKVCRGDRIVFYIADSDAELWARPHYEFFDGRFEEIRQSRSAATIDTPPARGDLLTDIREHLIEGGLWTSHPLVERIDAAIAAPTTSPEPDAVRVANEALDLAQDLAENNDWLGTGSDQEAADKAEREVLGIIETLRAALSRPAHGGWDADQKELEALRKVGWCAQALLSADEIKHPTLSRADAVAEADKRLRQQLGKWQMEFCSAADPRNDRGSQAQ